MGFWKHPRRLVLASKSATRASLLRQAGFDAELVDSQIDERAFAQTDPSNLALDLARAKAEAVSRRHPGQWVIGADQTLALGDTLFHKPSTSGEAADHLRQLAGKAHVLHAGVACCYDGETRFTTLSTARLHMRALSDAFIERYLRECGDQVMTSVGCYQIEGRGIHLFERIEGDHATILGLPLLSLLAFFRDADLIEA